MRKYDITSDDELHKLREEMSAELESLSPAERERYWSEQAEPLLKRIRNRRRPAGNRRSIALVRAFAGKLPALRKDNHTTQRHRRCSPMRKYDITSDDELHKLREEMSAELKDLGPAERERYWAKQAESISKRIKNRRACAGPRILRKTG